MKGGAYMNTATVRIPEDKRDILKVIAGVEKQMLGSDLEINIFSYP